MFTNHDRAKEQAEFIAKCPETEMYIENFLETESCGVASAKTFIYRNKLAQIEYTKWIVEGADFAIQMRLPGSEKHNLLIQGSGVKFFSETLNHSYTFYKQEAQDIIDACEQNRMEKIAIMTNNLER